MYEMFNKVRDFYWRVKNAFRTDDELLNYIEDIETDNYEKDMLIAGLEAAIVESRIQIQSTSDAGIKLLASLLTVLGGEVTVEQELINSMFDNNVQIDVINSEDGTKKTFKLVIDDKQP